MSRLLVFPLLFSLVYAEACTPEGPKEEGCPVTGNGDFYGLGVRIGIYSQWLTSWIANNFLAEEIIGSLETNSIFLLALFSTVFFYSVQPGEIRVVDVLVIHQLCLGFLFSIMSLWGYRTMYYKTEGPGGRRHFGGFGTHFRLVLMGMISSYGVWFWVEGVEDGLSPCDRRLNCGGLDTFFFVPVKVGSWTTRGIQLAIAIGAAAYYGIMALAALAAGTTYFARRVRGKPAHWELIAHQHSEVTLTKREFSYWYFALSCFNLFWIVFAMITVEFTLKLNHMNNVIGAMGLAGAGQLIPLGIGSISLVRVSYIILREKVPWLRKDEDSTPTAESPAVAHKYMGGLGLTMANTNSIYSPSPPQRHSNSPGKRSSANLESVSNLPPLPAIGAHRKRSLPHRILLAWLPWLGLFEWSRHSMTPSFDSYSIFSNRNKRDSGVGFESTRVTQKPAQRERNRGSTTTESPSTALLGSSPQLAPGQRGLMAATDDIEMLSRRSVGNSSDIGMYDGNGYDDRDEP